MIGGATARGSFHRIPPDRNLLAVVYFPGEDRSPSDDIIEDYGGERIRDSDGDEVEIYRFPDQSTMIKAQSALAAPGIAPEVLRTGAVVSQKPLAFLAGQIVIRFVDPKPGPRATSLLRKYGLIHVRDLPYISGGKLYRAPAPSYALYDLADELIPDHAEIALPNLISYIRNEGCDASACSLSFPNQEYLEQMDVCRSWPNSAPYDPVIGVLDQGFAGELAYTRLEVVAGINLKTMEDCVLGSAEWPIQNPAIPWKDASCKSVWHPSEHGIGVALTAAAKRNKPDDDLRGVAPGVKLINAARKSDLKSDIAVADALWWLGGGDPGWCRDGNNYDCTGTPCVKGVPAACAEPPLPGPLGPKTRADVINLSFDRRNFDEKCPDHGACQIVCAVDPCPVVENVLQALRTPQAGLGIRDGGVVVVAAAGIHSSVGNTTTFRRCDDCDKTWSWDFHTDLAESTATVAAGSVTTGHQMFVYDKHKICENGKIYPLPGVPCTISHPGSFLDVVAPMGGGGHTKLCKNACRKSFGKSSGAAAAVSGVAALMFRVNPSLTAPQAHCILKYTARKVWDPSTLNNWSYYDTKKGSMRSCSLDAAGLHSPCVGYGIPDACRAVAAAGICSSRSANCLCNEQGQPTCLNCIRHASNGKGVVIHGDLMKYVGCVIEQRCSCDTPDCLVVAVLNLSPDRLADVHMKACIEAGCRESLGRWEIWPPGEHIRVPLPTSPEVLSAWREGEAVYLRAFDSLGNRLDFEGE